MECWERETLKGFESFSRSFARVLMDFGDSRPSSLHEHLATKQPAVFVMENTTGDGAMVPFRSLMSSMGGVPALRRARPGGFWVAVYPRPLRQRLPFAAGRRRGRTREACPQQPTCATSPLTCLPPLGATPLLAPKTLRRY